MLETIRAYVADQRRKAVAWHESHRGGKQIFELDREAYGLVGYDKGEIDAYADVLDFLSKLSEPKAGNEPLA